MIGARSIFGLTVVSVLLFGLWAGYLLSQELKPSSRLAAANGTAQSIRLALPQYEVVAADLKPSGPNVIIYDMRSRPQYPDIVARIEVGLGGELFPLYWDPQVGQLTYHWNKSENLDEIINNLENYEQKPDHR